MNHMDLGDAALDELLGDIIRKSVAFKRGFREGFRAGAAVAAALCVLVLLVALSGCGVTREGTLIRDAVKTEGAKAYDEGMANAMWYICRAASVGSVLRWVGSDAVREAAWRGMCVESKADLFSSHDQQP